MELDLGQDLHDQLDLFPDRKLDYSLGYIDVEQEIVEEFLDNIKQEFKQQKVKAQYHPAQEKDIDTAFTDPKHYFSWGLPTGLEAWLINVDGHIAAGTAIACTNTRKYVELDEHRPHRRFTHSTSPRLAQLMINLTELTPAADKTICDPFAGLGTFVTQAMLAGYNAIGIELEQELANLANENVAWAKQKFQTQTSAKVIQGDATKTHFSADAVVFEPYMGPFVESLPTSTQAAKLAQELSELYQRVFSNIGQSIPDHAKVVCILPSIIDSESELHPTFGFLDQLSNFQLQGKKIHYQTPDGSRIERYIFILEKS